MCQGTRAFVIIGLFEHDFYRNIALDTLVIPGTELRVSRLCLGTGEFGAAVSVPNSFALLDEFLKLGGNFIDTAHVYSDWVPGTRSTSEKTIGQWLAARKCRDQVFIATKCAHPYLRSMHIPRMSHAEIRQDLTESLEYLRTDRIDLMWLHRDDPARSVSEIIDTLNAPDMAAAVRYWGASNWTAERLQAANEYANNKGLRGFVANQPMWSLATFNKDQNPDPTMFAMDNATLAFHRRTGMAVIPYTSQARGYFTKLASGAPISDLDRRVFGGETNRRRLEKIRTLAQKFRADTNDIVLAYLLSQPIPTIPVVGPKRIDQLYSSLKALSVKLSEADLSFLEAVG